MVRPKKYTILPKRKVISVSLETLEESPVVDALFSDQIESMKDVLIPLKDLGLPGRCWGINPAFGKGEYRYYPLDDIIAIAVFDFDLSADASFSCRSPDFFCFGKYSKSMVSYFDVATDECWENGTLLGYAWRGGQNNETIYKNVPLCVTSISIMPEALQRLSLRFKCSPLVLSSAIAALDGKQNVLGLSRLFDEIRDARPSSATAKIYYESKVTEAIALLIDWWQEEQRGRIPKIRAVDRIAFNLVCAYIQKHLGQPFGLDELCHLVCMSPGKLTGLFKQIEGKTPMEYARVLRMEYARDLLTIDDSPIASVAAQVGFTRQGSFSEAFRKHYGISPRVYRNLRTSGRR